MLHIFQSNRLEILADALAVALKDDAPAVLEKQIVVVQERGLARWLSLALAERNGIAANIEFPFPAGLIWSLFARVLPEVPDESPFDPAVLRWHCMRLLERSEAIRHPRLRQALAGDSIVRRHELAQRLAALFDRYLVYRPRWIAEWSGGRTCGLGVDEIWQVALWRELAAALPEAMHAHPAKRFYAALSGDAAARAALPRSLHLFAIQALPPMYLEFYARLAEWTEVNFYTLNPCEQQWGEIVRRRDQALRVAEANEDTELHFETGNSLLASLGRHGRVFFDSLSALPANEQNEYHRNDAPTLLALLQNDVLDLCERGENAEPIALVADDESVQVHVCHSAMREVEVLHDRLLDAFARNPALRADDVLVLVPKIEDYAAAIDAVFATAPAPRRLPYVIADRPPQKESTVLRSFLKLLHLPETRLQAESVLALLEEPPIARRHAIAADDLPLVRQWVRETGIRWGYDEKTRAALDLPATREHSWGAGFDRLLLGYAMAEEALFDGLLPYPDIEGGGAQLAGRLKTFIDTLAALTEELARPRKLSQWQGWAERTLLRLYACDEIEERDAQAIRSAATSLAVNAQRAAFDNPVPVEVWRREMTGLLESSPLQPFGSGIVFAALRPLRATPAHFVAVLGLNDRDFPRNPPQASFDLMAEHSLPGDRLPRDEERYALLEALLAARERLYLSYTGRSQRDNAELPPSPVLTEVLEAIRRSASASGRIFIEHPLQPFSRRYFDGSDARLFSYAAEYAHSGVLALSEPPFVSEALPETVLEEKEISLEALWKFLRNPAEYFLRERLGLRLASEEEILDENEPFALDGLSRWALRHAVLEHRLQGFGMEKSRGIARAAGWLPHGAIGDAVHAKAFAEVQNLYAAIRAAGSLRREEIALQFGELNLRGSLAALGGHNLLWHEGELKAKRLLHAWVSHLALNASGLMLPTVLYGLDESRNFSPVEGAGEILQALLRQMRAGLIAPWPFFPEAALAYMKASAKGEGAARFAAQKSWAERESADAWMALAFRGRYPLDEHFIVAAQAIYGPLLRAINND